MHYLITALIVLLSASFSQAKTECDGLVQVIQFHESQLETVKKKEQALEKEFQHFVERDLASQANRLMDSLNRNAAKKAFFAKRKIQTAKLEVESNLTRTTAMFCKKCKKVSEKELYCRRCPKHARCDAPEL